MIKKIIHWKLLLGMFMAAMVSTYLWYFKVNGFLLGYDPFYMMFFDADDCMMLTRIRDFFLHGTTSYSLLNRVNVPHGVDLYWSHLYDAVLISFTWIVSFFTSSIESAVEVAGFVIAPIIRLLIGWVFLIIYRKISPKIAVTSVIIFLLHINLSEIFSLGRPDHHAFIMMLEVGFLWQLQRMIYENTYLNQLIFSALATLCFWASVETLPFVLICEVALFFTSSKFSLNDFFRINLWLSTFIAIILSFSNPYILGIILLLSVVIFLEYNSRFDNQYVSICLLLVTFTALLSDKIIYDELSTLHLNLCVVGCLYFLLLKLIAKKNIFIEGICGCALGSVFLYFYPNFFLGIEGNASEFLRNFWFPTIADLGSILNMPHVIFNFIFWIESIVFAIVSYEKIRKMKYSALSNDDTFWIVLIVLGSCYAIFSILACRMIMTWYMLIIPAIVEGLLHISRKYYKILSVVLILVPPMGYIVFSSHGEICSFKGTRMLRYKRIHELEFFKALNDISDKPEVIMSNPYLGPNILYYSKHKVVAVPFHRQHEGLIASLIVTQWKEYNEKLTIKALLKTNSAYILVNSAAVNKGNLADIVANDYAPKWLSGVITDGDHILKLAKIDRDLLEESMQ